MAQFREVWHGENGRLLLPRARWCDNFASRLRGFTFRRRLAPDEGLVLVESGDSRSAAGIHMLFVFVALGVIWVDEAGKVVDTVVARPWRPLYLPQAPARYVIEGAPGLVNEVAIGDAIRFA